MTNSTAFPPPQPGSPLPAPAPADKPKKNVLGIIALVIAVIGFILAVTPGALIGGWVLLPIAFILAIVSFFLQGKKVFSIIALIVSVVGTIAGVIAFVVGAANAVNDAVEESFGGSDVVVSEPTDEATEAAVAEEEAPTEEEATGQGTRENPLPLGSTIDSDEWSITINSVSLAATEQVMAENPFNEDPDEGHEYILINVTATYLGDESGMPAFGTSVEYVTVDGVTIKSYDSLAVAPDAFDSTSELYNGGTVAGNLALAVPSDSAADGTLAVSAGLFADTVFFALQ